MTTLAHRGQSPFYPNQPVPSELFVGREEQVHRIVTRGIGQVAAGKPTAIFIEGEYGIGKSSISRYLQKIGQNQYRLHPIYVALRGVKTVEEVASKVVEATIKSASDNPSSFETIGNWLSKYLGKQDIGGFKLNFELLKKENPSVSDPYRTLDFLRQYYEKLRISDPDINGIFLVIDEINGIASEINFAHFVKALVDDNALTDEPLPLLLLLCGTEDRRTAMIKAYEPINRIFDVIQINAMNDKEMRDFFHKSFNSVNFQVNDDAIDTMSFFSAGLPKIMHTVGEEAFFFDTDEIIDKNDALEGVLRSKEQIGSKYVEPQVLSAIRSADYHSILEKLMKKIELKSEFHRSEIVSELSETEKRKLSNFLQKMKSLDVIRSGERAGEYIFNIKMVQVYLWLRYTVTA